MFLLILLSDAIHILRYFTLHSNMFLLIPGLPRLFGRLCFSFTFQYVSINTGGRIPIMDAITNFTFQYVSINTHFSLTEKDQLNLFFTFQYVSINTGQKVYTTDVVVALHSNMFLLIHRSRDISLCIILLYIPICFY